MDVSGDREPLTSNPFEKLRISSSAVTPAASEVPEDGTKSEPPPPSVEEQGPSFTIKRTKKGGLPISLEKRAQGKTVTVVRNLSGNAGEFLAILKKRCGAGGVLRDGAVELQGDHRATIEAFLNTREKASD